MSKPFFECPHCGIGIENPRKVCPNCRGDISEAVSDQNAEFIFLGIAGAIGYALFWVLGKIGFSEQIAVWTALIIGIAIYLFMFWKRKLAKRNSD